MQQITQKPGYEPREIYSPTQISAYDLCARKWGFKYLDGWRAPQTKAQSFGSEVDRILTRYYEGGPLVGNGDAGAVALAMVPYLPDPEDCDQILAQRSINVQVPYRISDESKMDLLVHFKETPSFWHLFDYKSTKDLSYVPTPEKLYTDVQCVIYSHDLVVNKELNEVRARWVYGQKPPKKVIAKPVDIVLPKAHIEAEWERICDQSLKPMTSLVREKKNGSVGSANDLPPNWEACYAYGGCEYSAAKGGPCSRLGTAGNGFKLGDAIMTQQQRPDINEILAQRRAQNGAVAGAPPAAAPMPAPGAAPGYPPQAQAAYAPPPAQHTPPAQHPAAAAQAWQGAPPAVQQPGYPPPQYQQPQHPLGPPEQQQAYAPQGQAPYVPPVPQQHQAPPAPYVPPQHQAPAAPVVNVTHVTPPVEAPAARGGRPKGSKNKATDGADISDEACAAIGFIQGSGSALAQLGVTPEQAAELAARFGKALTAELAKT